MKFLERSQETKMGNIWGIPLFFENLEIPGQITGTLFSGNMQRSNKVKQALETKM